MKPKLIEPKDIWLIGNGEIWITAESPRPNRLLSVQPLGHDGCQESQVWCDDCWAGIWAMFKALRHLTECGSFQSTKAGAVELMTRTGVKKM